MALDLERFLKDLRGALPYPGSAASEKALGEVIAVTKSRGGLPRGRSAAMLAFALIAASVGSFMAGRWTTSMSGTNGVPSAAAFLPLEGSGANTPRAIAVRCRVETLLAKWDARGHIQILEYTWGSTAHRLDHPVPTGRVLAYADAAARIVNPACSPVKSIVPLRRAYDTAAYDPHVRLQFYCNDLRFARPGAAGFVIQIRPIVNRNHRVIGNRLLVQEGSQLKAAPMIDATLAGRESRFSVRVQRCVRPFWE
jgi:hypothetical protein